MSSDYQLSYSFSMGSPAPEQPAQEALYAFGDCSESNLGGGAVLLSSRARPRRGMVSRDVSIALDHCRSFHSLREHAAYLTRYMPELGGDAAGVRRVLESVRDNGLLEDAAPYAGTLAAADETPARTPSRVFILTCDRPDAVQRLLDSLLAGSELAPHEALFLVDDSRDSANAGRNRELVAQFNLTSPRNMQYFGAQERRDLLAGLLDALPQHERSLRFLLDGERWQGQPTHGLARTLCLLLSVGRRAIMLDDDVLCSAYDSPYTAPGAGFTTAPCEADFYPSIEAWHSRFRPRRQDPLQGHLLCLGLSPGAALRRLELTPEPALLQGAEEALLRRLSADSRILVTQNGTFGDPGTGNTAWAFNLSGDSLQRLLSEPAAIEAKLATRQNWLGWSRPTFASHANMSQVTGLDNSALLPPYFPAGRGEDLLFGAVTAYLHPGSLTLNYPWATPHLPLEARRGDVDLDPERCSGMELMSDFIAAAQPDDGAAPEDRLDSLVLLLRGLAGRSDRELAGLCRDALATRQAASLRQLGDHLRSAGAGDQRWRELLESRRQHYLDALGRNEVALRFSDTPADPQEAATWRALRELLADAAAAMQAWPEIRRAADALVQRSGDPGL